jgi:hypothetical protein
LELHGFPSHPLHSYSGAILDLGLIFLPPLDVLYNLSSAFLSAFFFRLEAATCPVLEPGVQRKQAKEASKGSKQRKQAKEASKMVIEFQDLQPQPK